MSYKKVKLKEVLTHRKGSILIENDKDYKLCRVQLHRKGVLLRQIQKGTEIRTKKQQLCKTGDFIVAEMDAKLGGYGLIPEELDGAIVSSHYYLFETNEEKISREFLQVLSQTNAIQKQIKAKGSTNYSSIRPHEVLEFEIYLPSLNEQMNIVKMYKSFYEQQTIFQTELKTQSNLLSKLRQAYLQEAVMGKLTEPSQDDAKTLLADIKSQKAQLIKEGKLRKEKPLPPIKPEETLGAATRFEIPDNWVWCRLGEITNIFRGSSPRPKGDNRYFSTNPTDYNWITISDITNFSKDYILHSTREFLTEAGTKMGTFVDKNEFIIAVSGSTTGKCCLTGISGYVYDGLGVVRVFDKSLINEYLLIYMLQFYGHINGSKEGSTFPNINTDFLKHLPIPLPPLSEQKAIVEKVEGLLAKVSLLEEENKLQQREVQRLMGAVLQEAFGGR